MKYTLLGICGMILISVISIYSLLPFSFNLSPGQTTSMINPIGTITTVELLSVNSNNTVTLSYHVLVVTMTGIVNIDYPVNLPLNYAITFGNKRLAFIGNNNSTAVFEIID